MSSAGNENGGDSIPDGVDLSAALMGGKPDSAKKKKGRKKKLSAAEKQLAKLEKECDTLRRSGDNFLEFLDRIDRWLTRHAKKIMELFRKFDQSGEGVVTYDEFKAGLRDLNAPCNSTELHLLVQILDVDSEGVIDFLKIEENLQRLRLKEEDYGSEEIRPALQPTVRNLPHCPCCKLAVWDGENYKEQIPRYIEVLFRLAPFESYKSHPGHFNKLVHSTASIKGLIELIQEETGIYSTRMAVFDNISREADSILQLDKTLEDYEYESGTRTNPSQLLLFYDYIVDFKDCPLLLCDHYFGQKYDKV